MDKNNSTPIELLASVDDALNGPGQRIPMGIHNEELLHEYIGLAVTNSEKPYCVVSDWQMWYVSYGDDISDLTDTPPRVEMILYAKNVIEDEKKRFKPGSEIRTTPIVRMVFMGIFESLNTVYILVGDGVKKAVSIDAVNQVFHRHIQLEYP